MKVSVLLLLVTSICFTLSAQKELKKEYPLLVQCKIGSSEKKKLKTVEIRVYEENKMLSEEVRINPKTYAIELEKDKKYVLEFSKEGFIPKRVLFDTQIPVKTKKMYLYEMEIELLKPAEIAQMNDIDLDFPIAIIRYSIEKKGFEHCRFYTHQMQLEELKMMKRKGQIN